MTRYGNRWGWGRLATSMAILGSVALLAGCSDLSLTNYSETPQMKGNPNTQGLSRDEAQNALKPGGDFTNVVAKAYYDMSSTRADAKDYVDSDFYARKSLAASNGQTVLPEDNKRWAIPGQGDAQTRTQMDQQRTRLISALDNGGRERFPDLAAHSQVTYDCWVERTEMNYRAEWHGQCYREFMTHLADLEVALRPQFQVYFDYNSSKLNAAAQKVVSDAAAGLPAEGTWHFELIGHADKSGTNPYNMKLSQRRAQAVRTALENAGVPSSRIQVISHGEGHIPVQTADSVKEPKNRVVEGYGVVQGVTQASKP